MLIRGGRFKNAGHLIGSYDKLFIDASIIFANPATIFKSDAPAVLHKLQNPTESKILILAALFLT